MYKSKSQCSRGKITVPWDLRQPERSVLKRSFCSDASDPPAKGRTLGHAAVPTHALNHTQRPLGDITPASRRHHTELGRGLTTLANTASKRAERTCSGRARELFHPPWAALEGLSRDCLANQGAVWPNVSGAPLGWQSGAVCGYARCRGPATGRPTRCRRRDRRRERQPHHVAEGRGVCRCESDDGSRWLLDAERRSVRGGVNAPLAPPWRATRS